MTNRLQTGIAMMLSTASAGSAPEWIELMPIGEVRLGDGRKPYILEDAEAVIERSFAGVNGNMLPVDRDHGLDRMDEGGDGGAYGWIMAMEVREGSVWGKVEWTEEGAALVASRKYRFVSPTFYHTKTNRVTRFQRVALTNNPAIVSMKALAHSETPMNKEMKALAEALGLGEDAEEAEVLEKALAAVRAGTATETALKPVLAAAGVKGAFSEAVGTALAAKLTAKSGEEPDPTEYVSKAAFDDLSGQLKALQTRVGSDAVEKAVAAAKASGKLSPAMEEWGRALAAKDMASFDAWEKTAPVLAGDQLVPDADPGERKSTLTADQKAICKAMGVTEEAFLEQQKKEQAA